MFSDVTVVDSGFVRGETENLKEFCTKCLLEQNFPKTAWDGNKIWPEACPKFVYVDPPLVHYRMPNTIFFSNE